MKAAYQSRPVAIRRCIDRTSEIVRLLKTQREKAQGDDPAINRALRKEQTKVSHTGGEEIVFISLSLSVSCG